MHKTLCLWYVSYSQCHKVRSCYINNLSPIYSGCVISCVLQNQGCSFFCYKMQRKAEVIYELSGSLRTSKKCHQNVTEVDDNNNVLHVPVLMTLVPPLWENVVHVSTCCHRHFCIETLFYLKICCKTGTSLSSFLCVTVILTFRLL